MCSLSFNVSRCPAPFSMYLSNVAHASDSKLALRAGGYQSCSFPVMHMIRKSPKRMPILKKVSPAFIHASYLHLCQDTLICSLNRLQ